MSAQSDYFPTNLDIVNIFLKRSFGFELIIIKLRNGKFSNFIPAIAFILKFILFK